MSETIKAYRQIGGNDLPAIKDDPRNLGDLKIETITEGVTDAGVTIDGVTIKDYAIYPQYNKTISGDSIDVAGAITLTSAYSGYTFLLDKADGLAFTLPTEAVGMKFRFVVTTAVTSNAYSITSAATADLHVGGLVSIDTDTGDAVAFWKPDASNDDALSMNGSTTGGLVGTDITFECFAANRWHVTGVVFGSGEVATPFA